MNSEFGIELLRKATSDYLRLPLIPLHYCVKCGIMVVWINEQQRGAIGQALRCFLVASAKGGRRFHTLNSEFRIPNS